MRLSVLIFFPTGASGLGQNLSLGVMGGTLWRRRLALHRRYRLVRDRGWLLMEPIRGLLVAAVLTPHSFRIRIVLLQFGDEERNVIVGNAQFHRTFLSPKFPAAMPCADG